MWNNKYANPENWHLNSAETEKARQIDMLKKHYNYSDNQYVLWIVPDLFHNTPVKNIEATVEIKTKTDDIFKLPKTIIRKPYPNKHIRQLSMTSGRQRLYGIPLIFDRFEDLCDITAVIISWHIYETDDCLTILNVRYDINFEKDAEHEDYKFFTIFSKDTICDIDNFEDYQNQFSLMKRITECSKEDMLNSEMAIIYALAGMNYPPVIIENIDLYNLYIYENKETLKATYMANILASSAFGFK